MRNALVSLALVVVIAYSLLQGRHAYVLESVANREAGVDAEEPEVIDPDNGIRAKPANKLMAESVANSKYIPDKWPNKRHSWKSIQMG